MNIAEWDTAHARRFGRLDGLVVEGRTWTNAELYDQVCRLAGAYVELGLRPGDRVAVSVTNSRELFVAVSAAWRAGGVVAVLPVNLRSELTPIIRHCEPRIVLSSFELDRAQLGGAAPILVGGRAAGNGSYALHELLADAAPLPEIAARAASDPAQLCYTSGVNGRPRAVVMTHGGIDTYRRLQAARKPIEAGHRVFLLAAPPTAFGTGFIGVRLTAPFKYVLLEKFTPERVLEAIEQHGVNVLPLVPTMAEQLAAHVPARRYDVSSVRSIAMGGSHASQSLIDRLRVLFGIEAPQRARLGDPAAPLPERAIYVHYGMTEAGGGLATGMGLDDGVVGPVHENAELRVVDGAGREVTNGDVGQFVVRTPYQGVGYWNDPEATAKTFRDGYIHTGDLGYLNERRDVCIVGRASDVIIQGGYNVQAREVADVVESVDGVQQCVVVGLPDDLLGEVVTACVVGTPGRKPREEEVFAHCRQRLDSRKCPGLVFVFDELPRTHTGKVEARALRQKAAELRSAPGTSALCLQLESAEPSRRDALLRAAVLRELAAVLRRSRGDAAVDATQTFSALGLDSIGAVQLANGLSRLLGKTLSATLLYSHATVAELAAVLVEDLFGAPAPLPAPAPMAAAPDDARVAIVGIGCRLPGGVNGPSDFWRLLEQGRDATTLASEKRWPRAAGNWRAGFLDGIERFDAAFFRLAGHAEGMDPQHRLFLEVAWEALDDAGCNPLLPVATSTGIFFGIQGQRYLGGDPLGMSPAMAVARLAHFLDVHGPVVSIDATCASSLVALHQAVQSLRARECDTAIVGGVNLIAEQGPPGLMSARGRCRAFDDGADGFGQGEGCAAVVLKRLSDALAAQDRIYATVLGTAINHDGRSSSLVAPNANAQEDVIRAALRSAGAAAETVQYVEAHGTGTQLGDAIEIEALARVFPARADRRVAIGSVKTNVGHLEAAAGVAGIIKVALAMRERRLPRSLHFETPNTNVPWQQIGVRVQAELGDWPAAAEPLVAGVSSFGMSGTNAHAIVGEAPKAASDTDAPPPPAEWSLLPISAKSTAALTQYAQRYADALENELAGARPDSIAYTAGCRRVHLEHRLAVPGRSVAEWAKRLRELAAGGGGAVVSGHAPAVQRGLVMVFSGQGSQWWGMARELLERESVFRAAVEQCAAHVDSHVEWRLLEELRRDEATSRLHETRIAQPALFAVEVGLWELWRSWGVEPVAVVGHSLGEVSAAYAAGVMSLERAARLVCERGRIMHGAPAGSMAFVGLPAEQVARFVAEHALGVELAATNGPAATTIAGSSQQVAKALEMLERRGVEHRLLDVGHAFHSQDFAAPARELTSALGEWESATPRIRLVSTVTGATAPPMDAAYWGRQMRSQVRFLDATKTLLDDGASIFVEVGPHPVLLPSLLATIKHSGRATQVVAVPTLRRGVAADEAMLESVARVHCAGYPVSWARQRSEGAGVVTLPSYPWQHRPFWQERAVASAARIAPLLDVALPSASAIGTYHYEMTWNPSRTGQRARRDQGSAPPVSQFEAVLVEFACEASLQAFGGSGIELSDVCFLGAAALDKRSIRVQLVLEKTGASTGRFRIYSWSDAGTEVSPCAIGDVEAIEGVSAKVLPMRALQEAFGEALRGGCVDEERASVDAPSEVWTSNGETLAALRAEDGEPGDFVVQPNHLCQALRAGVLTARQHSGFASVAPLTIVRIGRLRAYRGLGAPSFAWLRPSDASHTESSEIRLLGAAGSVLFEAVEVQTKPGVSPQQTVALQKMQWQAAAAPRPESAAGTWLIVAARRARHADLAAELRARGGRVRTLLLGRPTARETEQARGRPKGRDAQDVLAFVDDGDGAQLQRALAAVAAELAPSRVVYLCHAKAIGASRELPRDAGAACERETLRSFRVLQAIARTEWQTPPSCFVVTRGVQSVNKAAPNLVHAALWGGVHTLALEQPELSARLIDMDSRGFDAASLCDELCRRDGEPRVVLRGEQRLVARLARYVPGSNGDALHAHSADARRVHADRTYMVTGGLGGLGLVAAERLVELGARYLVLVGRRAPSEEAVRSIERWEARGVRVVVERVDVADENALGESLRGLELVLPPLAGVVHAAGAIRDGVLVNLGEEAIRAVLAAKIRGVCNLHRLTKDLDFLVLFSSLASVTGNPGQANYSAANAFLDAFAYYRRSHGAPAVSIDWCGWRGIGMAAGIDVPAALSVTAAQGGEVFTRVLLWSRETQVVVQPRPYLSRAPLCEHLRRNSPAAVLFATEPGANASTAAPTGRHASDLDEILRSEIAAISAMGQRPIADDARLSALGVDSLDAIQLRANLVAKIGIHIPAADLGNDPTFGKLLGRLRGAPAGAAKSHSPVIHIRPEGHDPRIVLVHPVGGGVACYRSMAAALPYRVSAIESPALHDEHVRFASIRAMARHYLDELAASGVEKPGVLGGWSFGGLVALEMATCLHERGHDVRLVVLIDSHLATGVGAEDSRAREQLRVQDEIDIMRSFLVDVVAGGRDRAVDVREVDALTAGAADGDLSTYTRRVIDEASRRGWLGTLAATTVESLLGVFRSHLSAIDSYRPQPYAGRVLLVRASAMVGAGTEAVLRRSTDALVVERVEGDHYSIMHPPVVAKLVELISAQMS